MTLLYFLSYYFNVNIFLVHMLSCISVTRTFSVTHEYHCYSGFIRRFESSLRLLVRSEERQVDRTSTRQTQSLDMEPRGDVRNGSNALYSPVGSRKQHQRRSSTRVSCLALVVRNILKHEDGTRHGKRWRARWRFSVCRSGTIVFWS